MKGEVVAKDREENTILEEHLDVQRHGKFSMLLTSHLTRQLRTSTGKRNCYFGIYKKNYQRAGISSIFKGKFFKSFNSPSLKRKEQLSQKPQSAIIQDVTQKSLVEDYENLLARSSVRVEIHSVIII